MAKRAEKHGNGQTATGGQGVGGHGWVRPGFITLPGPANDNRLTAARLLRQPRFWVWAGLMALLVIVLVSRL
ncbi:hypothetical protein [Ferrovibrio sp.]|uniref:hypothetical protein n=1 Tax=Ferrovibrio sp. TaxID=1917215 RepID=UPI0025C6728D|nr:hypothetical protein [Ferrovibrio sp.]MBX3454392.1 hypothetical protein [Ferrovibrio sp.]